MKPAHRYWVRRAVRGALLVGSLAAPASAQQSGCESYVAPFFRGTGGFVAKPSDGRSVGLTVRRGSSSRVETLFARSDGLVVQLLNSSTNASLCSDDSGAPVECRILFSGIEDGGWYWVNGDRNAAVAPLICEDELGGSEALDPGGVSITRSEHGTATLFVHDAQKLMGIIPHLAPAAGGPNSCQERVAPIFRGEGGYVLKPASGESPVLTIEEEPGGRTESRNLDVRPEDGLAVGLLSSPLCPGAVDQPVVCRVSFSGVEDGGWYWVNGDRNAAVAPLVCAEQLGGASALDPGGVAVTASTRGTGTLVVHETQSLMAIVPHLVRVPEGVADVVVESVAVSESSLGPGQRFTLSTEVLNRGGGRATATTLHWYRSSDSGIDDSDTEVGMSSLAALDASGRTTASIDLEAPSDTGAYWYGACVEAVEGESDTENNCSGGATVEVVGLPPSYFILDSQGVPYGMTYAGGRLYVFGADRPEGRVSAYGSDGSRVAEFRADHPRGFGIAYAGGHFYLAEGHTGKVYAYGSDGGSLASAGFDLDPAQDSSLGTVYVGRRLYVVDRDDHKVYVYEGDGSRVASADFNLAAENTEPRGMAYANGRFHVVDWDDDMVYAYESDGTHAASADFDLSPGHERPTGIAYVGGRFYVVNSVGTGGGDVRAYDSSGNRVP